MSKTTSENKIEIADNLHNCKYVSLEMFASKAIESVIPNLVGKTKTLLVPCRDAWDHAMSWCNFKRENPLEFKCEELASQCMSGAVYARYSRAMVKRFDWVNYYDFSTLDNLVDDLSSALPHRSS